MKTYPKDISVSGLVPRILTPEERAAIFGRIAFNDGTTTGLKHVYVPIDPTTARELALLFDSGISPEVFCTQWVKFARQEIYEAKPWLGTSPLFVHFRIHRTKTLIVIHCHLSPKSAVPHVLYLASMTATAVAEAVRVHCKTKGIAVSAFELQAKKLAEQADLVTQASQALDEVPADTPSVTPAVATEATKLVVRLVERPTGPVTRAATVPVAVESKKPLVSKAKVATKTVSQPVYTPPEM